MCVCVYIHMYTCIYTYSYVMYTHTFIWWCLMHPRFCSNSLCSQVWPWLLIPLPIFPKCWANSCELHLVYVALRIEPRASCLLSQQPTSRAPSRVLHAFYLFLQEKAVVASTGSCLRECWDAISSSTAGTTQLLCRLPQQRTQKTKKNKTKKPKPKNQSRVSFSSFIGRSWK